MIQPVGAMLLLKQEEKKDKKTSSGLVIAAGLDDDGIARGEIVAMGAGEPNALNGELIKMSEFSIGDKVVYPDHSGTLVEDHDGSKYLVIHHKHILAKVK
jgi:co-chaperonin GroES (HSP10)